MGNYFNYRIVYSDIVKALYDDDIIVAMSAYVYADYSYLCNCFLADLRHHFVEASIDFAFADSDCELGFVPSHYLLGLLSDYIESINSGLYDEGFSSESDYANVAFKVTSVILDYEFYIIKECY